MTGGWTGACTAGVDVVVGLLVAVPLVAEEVFVADEAFVPFAFGVSTMVGPNPLLRCADLSSVPENARMGTDR